MAEYIEREALQKAMQRKKAGVADKRYTEGYNDCLLRMKSMVHGAKAADVVPVVRGKWKAEGFDNCYCSRCIKTYIGFFASSWNYCPNCGAKMDGERIEDV